MLVWPELTPTKMEPLRFEPLFRRYLWGGRRLATVLDKQIGPEDDYAESWEIVDRLTDQSVVANGSMAGLTLNEVLSQSGRELLGPKTWSAIDNDALPPQLRGRFPLLLKFLDANDVLSVQVHPDDETALGQVEPDLGKTEAWYVLDADPGSVIYAGLKQGVDRARLQQAVDTKTTESVLHQIRPKPGDCIFVPAGTVHAIGSGLLIAEIQQSSDTTFRLFDWDRVDAEGNRRPLHIEQALQATDYSLGPVEVQPKTPTEIERVFELVSCEHFKMRLWQLTKMRSLETQNQFRLLTVVAGEMQVSTESSVLHVNRGQTILVPASLPKVRIEPLNSAEFLEITTP